MNIHEFQAKELLGRFGVPVPAGRVAQSPQQAAEAFAMLGAPRVVVKAQIHAGGRGKAGGIRIVETAEQAGAAAEALLGKPLVTHQTGPQGRIVRRLYLEPAQEVARELYLALTVDRRAESVAIVASTEGGMEIEQVAAANPERIVSEVIDPLLGVAPFQARELAAALGLREHQPGAFSRLAGALYRAFVDTDAGLIEINPLVVTAGGALVCLDAKVSFDDNALFRHPEIRELRDPGEEDPAEVEAQRYNLNYVHLDGNIGCMVNGAGLAMATMDIIKYYGGEPANFLDVGGGANAERVAAAFGILLADSRVRAVLVNIFGGIVRCDMLAQGVVEAARQVKLSVPLVVRMEGTNVAEGRRILRDSGLNVITGSDMADAARRAVEALKQA